MIRYIPEDTTVVLAEVPDEISLAINLSNCPHRCPGCHSPYLQENKGDELTFDVAKKLIDKNCGITCVVFMGGDSTPAQLVKLVYDLRQVYPELKFAVYSGNPITRPDYIATFDYIKLGEYKADLGGLDSETTNQKFFKKIMKDGRPFLENQTYKFKKKW